MNKHLWGQRPLPDLTTPVISRSWTITSRGDVGTSRRQLRDLLAPAVKSAGVVCDGFRVIFVSC